MSKLKILVILNSGILYLNISCNPKNGKKVGKEDIFSVALYCTCLEGQKEEKGNYYFSSCTLEGMKAYSNIVNYQRLIKYITGPDTVEKVKNIFYTLDRVKNLVSFRQDPRFVILFKYKAGNADTFSFKSNDASKFYYNDNSLFAYKFNVIDSLAKVLGEEKLTCD